MKSHKIVCQIVLAVLIMLFANSCRDKETELHQRTDFIDVSQARAQVEVLVKLFSEEFIHKDSVALANHYLPDGMIGSVKGHDNIVSTWHNIIQNADDKGTPNLRFITNSIATDNEYIIELGVAQWADQNGNVKRENKYLVVYKQEGGELKLYRDWGL